MTAPLKVAAGRIHAEKTNTPWNFRSFGPISVGSSLIQEKAVQEFER